MSADVQSAWESSAAEPMVEIEADGGRYRLALPHAGTDYIQTKLLQERVPYEQEMLRDMAARLRPGDLVVDVGANIGNHTLYLAMVAGCRVESFEPNGALAEGMLRSVALNGLDGRVRVHQVGVGACTTTARFLQERPDNLGAQRLELGAGELPVHALDHFPMPASVALLKIDVEGMELDVLRGARALLQRDRPMVYVECQREIDFRRVSRELEPLGYGYWDTFNGTPTHLFLPDEKVDPVKRLNRAMSHVAAQQYRLNQLWTALKRLQPSRSPRPGASDD